MVEALEYYSVEQTRNSFNDVKLFLLITVLSIIIMEMDFERGVSQAIEIGQHCQSHQF